MDKNQTMQGIIAAVIEKIAQFIEFLRQLASRLGSIGEFGAYQELHAVASLKLIRSHRYRTNDIIKLPATDQLTAGRILSVNGTELKLRAREDLVLRVLVDHNRTLARKCLSGSPSSMIFEFESDDFVNPAALAVRLAQPANPVSRFLLSRFNPETVASIRAVAAVGAATADQALMLRSWLMRDLNALLKSDRPIWDNQQFAGVGLSRETRRLMERADWLSQNAAHFNRLLLQDAYPSLLKRLPTPFLSVHQIIQELDKRLEFDAETVWKSPSPEDVYRAIDSLRAALHSAKLNEHLIEGDRGFGYRLSTPRCNLIFTDDP